MTLGLDVSKYQSKTPSLAGIDFLFARATYATTPDPMYRTHIANARRAGLVTGAYHFGVGWTSPTKQAAAFLKAAGDVDLYVLDLERDSAKTMSLAQADDFIKAVKAQGKRIGLYHSQSGFPQIGQNYNWVAVWRSMPPDVRWAFWQYTSSGHLSGYSGRLDLDRFNGTRAQLRAFAGITNLPDTSTPSKEAPVKIHAGVENWLLDGGPTRVTTIGAPYKDDGITIDGSQRVAYVAIAEPGQDYFHAIDRDRLSDWRSEMDKPLLAALNAYALPATGMTEEQVALALQVARDAAEDAERERIALAEADRVRNL